MTPHDERVWHHIGTSHIAKLKMMENALELCVFFTVLFRLSFSRSFFGFPLLRRCSLILNSFRTLLPPPPPPLSCFVFLLILLSWRVCIILLVSARFSSSSAAFAHFAYYIRRTYKIITCIFKCWAISLLAVHVFIVLMLILLSMRYIMLLLLLLPV